MSIEYIYWEEEITDRTIKEFLLNVKEQFEEIGITNEDNMKIERENKKKLQKMINDKFKISHIHHNWINKLYAQIFGNLQDIKFYKKENILDFDITNIRKEILKLQKNSQRLEKFYDAKLWETVLNIKNNIFDYLEDNLSHAEKKEIFKKIKPYTWDISKLKHVEIKQTLVQTMWKMHILITLVVQVNWKKLNIDILKNKKTWKIVENFITKATDDLHGWKKISWIKRKLYDNPDSGFFLHSDYNLDKSKFNLENFKKQEYINDRWEKTQKINFPTNLREKIKKWEKDNELNKFIQITKEWNKIFKKNKEELEQSKTEEEKEQIIDINAQAIADLFADNASLQWTMDFDNSHGMEWVKWYFLHFLATLPTMRFSEINKIDLIADNLLFAQWDYIFEVSDWKWWRIEKDANFAFYFEKNINTWKWGIKRLNSTFWKTEDNLKEV